MLIDNLCWCCIIIFFQLITFLQGCLYKPMSAKLVGQCVAPAIKQKSKFK